MLTPRLAVLLTFIARYQEGNSGVSPSITEMMSVLGTKSRNGVHEMLLSLEQRGCIARLKRRPRAIQILSMRGSVVATDNTRACVGLGRRAATGAAGDLKLGASHLQLLAETGEHDADVDESIHGSDHGGNRVQELGKASRERG